MKRIFTIISIAFLFSCKKANDTNLVKKEITGAWELAQFNGYPFNQPFFPPGNGQIIVLGKDGTFERKEHNTSLFKGKYLLEKKDDCYERENDLAILTNEVSWDNYQYIEIVNGRLAISTPNCLQDGGTAYYRRLE